MTKHKSLAALALAFALAFALSSAASAQVGPANAILCNRAAYIAPSTATTTLAIPAVAGQVIVICGWHVTSSVATDNSFSIIRGTQVTNPCDTAPSTLTGALHLINSAPSVDHEQFAVLSTPSGQQVCAITTAATALQITIWYAQYPG